MSIDGNALPDASAYHVRVALRELPSREILQAVAEYDQLGQDRFLEKHGFGAARSYSLVVDGKFYDSKAIVGAAHGFLPGQEPLTASGFSGGAATVGRLLSVLGFEVTQAVSGLTVGELIGQLAALRPYRSPDGRLAPYQPLTLLWAFGRAHQGLARTAEWAETELRSAGSLNVTGSIRGRTTRSRRCTTLAYGISAVRGQCHPVAAVAAIVDKYLQDADEDAILVDAGLTDDDIADDEVPAGDVIVARSPLEEEYRRLCGIGAGTGDRGTRFGQPRMSVDILRLGSARRAVLLRSEGHCENPRCTGEARTSPVPDARSWRWTTSRI